MNYVGEVLESYCLSNRIVAGKTLISTDYGLVKYSSSSVGRSNRVPDRIR